jgi:uncharacterized RDD family membrane protein YckC
VELRIAGPGSRCYAFVIDWHIRLILALAWFFVAAAVFAGGFAIFSDAVRPNQKYVYGVVLPAVAIYLLNHPVLEIAMRGRTPGKRMAHVRLVTRNGDIPGMGALLVRNLFRLIDSLPMFYLVGLGSVIFTEHHVRIGDLAGGTLLIMDKTEDEKTLSDFPVGSSVAGLSPQAADLIHELLERWSALDDTTRTNLARSLLGRVGSLPAETLTTLPASDLHAQLRTLLTTEPPA